VTLDMRFPHLPSFRIFPPTWDWRRVSECGIAAYQGSVGAVAFVHPQSLDHSSYSELVAMMTPQSWGFTLWLVAIGHISCIATNGRSPLRSTLLRTVACTLHFGVLLLVSVAYYKVGDYYRLVTTAFLVALVIAAMSIATEDMARVIERRRRR
jgi:hypothetical protein